MKTNCKDEAYYQAYLTHHYISRRGLFKGVLGATELPAEEKICEVHRPPFAARDDLFLAVCNGCGDCVSACPNNLLRLVHNKAELDIEYMACDLCGKCAEACQTHALYPYFPADTGLRPKFGKDCITLQGQSCDVCRESCSQKAIRADLSLVPDLCNGCGECKISCFVSAISLISPKN